MFEQICSNSEQIFSNTKQISFLPKDLSKSTQVLNKFASMQSKLCSEFECFNLAHNSEQLPLKISKKYAQSLRKTGFLHSQHIFLYSQQILLRLDWISHQPKLRFESKSA